MRPTAPKIGFDRFIRLEWAKKALEVRTGLAELDDLDVLLDEAHSGPSAKKKTRTVLNRLWLEPRKDLEPLAEHAVELFQSMPSVSPATLTWGMAIVTYPFFAKVAEIVGRLTSLQGDCTTAEVHRRMAEIYGEREGTRRMTNMVLQSMSDWAMLDRSSNGKILTRKNAILIDGPDLVRWMIRVILEAAGRPIKLGSLEARPEIFPFELGENLGFVVSSSTYLELATDSAGNQIVSSKV
ncbi:hypothetical protein RA28_03085 [Ruegeria sp. ANG-S4]|uniref:hypothetical protein n=1 Tax=Ruegeria sp. ANG-S4 TaxID=1577904 RepID=UPI00057F2B50|nr:hypothetical protein [Ruegeria sp. ANG-S4]KIC46755.1 hypothetical protein RA28_03085 [Ruegeria sp. ANG-S4]